ncbi:hypothetical protein ElyMa_002260600 [Elysia marginata]|uniref:Uncharacterized protein n=1 Tax=Elysia marginata TaxID=1093978 RepID=A0AAV4FYS7_9GAST|nr:hypothetical protein ElyMa_002260600 [Elysia marginata]
MPSEVVKPHDYSIDGQIGELHEKRKTCDVTDGQYHNNHWSVSCRGRPQKSRPRRQEGCCDVHWRGSHRTPCCRRGMRVTLRGQSRRWKRTKMCREKREGSRYVTKSLGNAAMK